MSTLGINYFDRLSDSGKIFSTAIQESLQALTVDLPFVKELPCPGNRLDLSYVLGGGTLGVWSPGGKAKKSFDGYNISIPVTDYEETFMVRRVDLNSIPAVQMQAAKLADQARLYRQRLVRDALTGGLANSTGGDGLSTFATTHLVGSGGTQSNKNNLALTYANVQTVMQTMKGTTDEMGNVIGVRPKYCVYGPNNSKNAAEVFAGATLTGSAGFNAMQGSLIPIEHPDVGGNIWYVLADDAVVYGVHQDITPDPSVLQGRQTPDMDVGVIAHLAVDCGAWFNLYINQP